MAAHLALLQPGYNLELGTSGPFTRQGVAHHFRPGSLFVHVSVQKNLSCNKKYSSEI